ncbi:MAG: Glutamate--cysteine ligase [Marinobacterium sp. xm-d-530]|nr:MAG: Glutamate--cysteine ligase [Marinobacterium sp. xm-d-530]
MLKAVKENLDRLIASGQQHLLRELGHGIEKEALRVDRAGQIAQTDHPSVLGSTLTHGQITTDYSEALLEFITGVSTDVRGALQELKELHQFTYSLLGHESLWCASMPCAIGSADNIRIAEYGTSNIGQLKYIYRVGLEHRYGKMMQTIAGIHYNFSISEVFWPAWKHVCGSELSDKDFASDRYFALIRNFRRYSWLLLYLFGASPAVSKDFLKSVEHHLEPLDEDTYYLPYATSLRMSDLGYSNRAQEGLNVCFNHLDTYADSLQTAIHQPHKPYESIGIKVDGHYRQLNSNVLQIENEYYSDIRPKRVTHSGEKPVHALMERGVQYIEVRNTDINPLLPIGIDLQQSLFMDAFLLTCLFAGEQLLTSTECSMVAHNKDKIVSEGRRPGLMLETLEGEISREQFANNILDQVTLVANLLDNIHGGNAYHSAVQRQYELIANPELTPSATIIRELESTELSFQEWTLKMGQAHRDTLLQEPINPLIKQQLEEEAKRSIAQQREAESQDQPSFDEFLQHYLAS